MIVATSIDFRHTTWAIVMHDENREMVRILTLGDSESFVHFRSHFQVTLDNFVRFFWRFFWNLRSYPPPPPLSKAHCDNCLFLEQAFGKACR